jgi:hypothetical protein
MKELEIMIPEGYDVEIKYNTLRGFKNYKENTDMFIFPLPEPQGRWIIKYDDCIKKIILLDI